LGRPQDDRITIIHHSAGPIISRPSDARKSTLATTRCSCGIAGSAGRDSGATEALRDAMAGQYVFNLSTKRSQFNSGQDLTEGRYRLTITEPSFCSPVVAEFDLTR
jgi:hypothetical protein